jgi:restriction system protein
MVPDWKQYQEEAAAFFRGLGLDAQTDVTVQGVRTTHEIDVFVTSHHVGFRRHLGR